MSWLREIPVLLWKETTLEWRQKYALSGILLYVLTTVYVVSLSFQKEEPEVWRVLFWVVFLFAAVNAVVKSFQQESSQRQLYYYTLAHPHAVLTAKILYNFLLLGAISLLTYGAMTLFSQGELGLRGPFWPALALGALGISTAFTFLSGIASKASNSATLMTILSFPLVIPILTTLLRVGALGQMAASGMGQAIRAEMLTLCAIDLLLLAAAWLLFPILWRE